MDANKIIYYRKNKNLSRYMLAKKVNIIEATLRDIEVKNTLNPRLNTPLSLAKVLKKAYPILQSTLENRT